MKSFLFALGLLVFASAHAADFCGKRSKTVWFNTFSYDFRHHRSANPENAIISVTGVPWAPGSDGTIKSQLNDEMDQAISNSGSAQSVKDFIGRINLEQGTNITFTSINGGMTLETQGQPKATILDPQVFAQLIPFIEKVIGDPDQNDGGEVSCDDFSVK